MKKNKYIHIVLFCLIAFSSRAQQESQYSQYMFNQLVLNPAYAGSKDLLSAAIFYRSQWNIDGAPRTATLSIHTILKKKKVGLGFSVVDDKIGPKKMISALGTYSYRIKFINGKLAFGLRAGVCNFSFNSWGDQPTFKDPAEDYRKFNASKTAFTSDAGLYYYSTSMYLGLSATNLFNSKLSSQQGFNNDMGTLVKHYFFTCGYSWAVSDKFIFSPSIVIKSAEGSPSSIDLNLSAMLDQKLWIGCSYRSQYGISVYTQIKVSDKFKIGYAFDAGKINKNRVKGIFLSTHEIMLGYDLNIFNSKIISPRYL